MLGHTVGKVCFATVYLIRAGVFLIIGYQSFVNFKYLADAL